MEMFQSSEQQFPIDPVEEMKLRTWARVHYLPRSQRDSRLHPVILDEMSRKDTELAG